MSCFSDDVEVSRVQVGDRHVFQKYGVADVDGDQRIASRSRSRGERCRRIEITE